MSQKTIIPLSHVKPSVNQLANNFCLDLTGRFITRFKRFISWIQSESSSIQCSPSHQFLVRWIFIIYFHPCLLLPTTSVGLCAIDLCNAERNPKMTRKCVTWLKNYEIFQYVDVFVLQSAWPLSGRQNSPQNGYLPYRISSLLCKQRKLIDL